MEEEIEALGKKILAYSFKTHKGIRLYAITDDDGVVRGRAYKMWEEGAIVNIKGTTHTTVMKELEVAVDDYSTIL